MSPSHHLSGFVRCGCFCDFSVTVSMSRGWFSGRQMHNGSSNQILVPSLSLIGRQHNFRGGDDFLVYALQMVGVLASALRTMAVCSKLKADKDWKITEDYYQVN